ncbi:hypothetical protein H8356DRAFT_1040847 [Neocallimastix lanati (nom. inval.)]|uniref:Uncharacterized protein n=1 Tax=Neocallimastix californiae TaxID=1754190 RepID=A0A1Y2E227_9FUNG|nr:hypothetical protein H8356DRAFT_1040847 [Neocallimastix sp. JGI-2020a]ORY65608.1 hypothetical protein LY90DRAFT_504955 [Neocallimastix californiae]|eukprot:ORY65608.1 hypothetical protein LY90DRAFT_504955 [Neocallimastix californiae]
MELNKELIENSYEDDTDELNRFKEKINPLLEKAVNSQSSFQCSLIVENNENTFNFTKKPYQYDKIRDPIFKNILDNYNKFNSRNSKFFLDQYNDVEKVLCNNDSRGGYDSDHRLGKENESDHDNEKENHINKKSKSKLNSNSNSNNNKKNSNHYIYYLIFVKEKGGKGSINGPFTTVSLKTYFQRENYFNRLLMKGRYSKYLFNLNNIIDDVETFKRQFTFKIKTNYFDFESFFGQDYLEKIENMTSIKEFANILKFIKKLNTDFPLENYLLHNELNEKIQHELEKLKTEILHQQSIQRQELIRILHQQSIQQQENFFKEFKRELLEEHKNLLKDFKRQLLEEQRNLFRESLNNIFNPQNNQNNALEVFNLPTFNHTNPAAIANTFNNNNIFSELSNTPPLTTTASADTSGNLIANIFNLGQTEQTSYPHIDFGSL